MRQRYGARPIPRNTCCAFFQKDFRRGRAYLCRMLNETQPEAPAEAAGAFKPMLKRWFYIFILFLWCPLLVVATASEIFRPAALDGWGAGGGWVLFWFWLATLAAFFASRASDFHLAPWQWPKRAK